MAKKGRPNAYVERIEPRKDEIITWAKAGATNAEIAMALGVGYSTFMDHVSKNQDFSDSLKQARLSGVPEVKLALFNRAVGMVTEDKKTYIKRDTDGNEYKYTEVTRKQHPPDVGAIQTYLRNNTEDFRDRDRETYSMKEMELELRRMQIENTLF